MINQFFVLIQITSFRNQIKHILKNACGFSAQALANTAWAFATVNQSNEKLLKASAREAERRVSEFNLQNIASTTWAFATMNQLDSNLPTHAKVPTQRVLQGELRNIGFAGGRLYKLRWVCCGRT